MATKKEILQLIEQAAKERWSEFSLRDTELTSLPPEIGTLTNLTSLRLDHNQLTTLPPEIAKLTNLTSLEIYNNKFTNCLQKYPS